MNTMIIDVQRYLRSSISNLLRQPLQGSSTVSLLNEYDDYRCSTLPKIQHQ